MPFLFIFFEVDIKCGAFFGSFKRNSSARTLYYMLGNRESESVAVRLGGEVRPEDRGLYLRRYTRAVVRDRYLDLAFRIGGIVHDDDIRR